MSVDFNWESYTPKNFTGFGSAGWKRPWDFAKLNITTPPDTIPELYQYIVGQDYSSGLRAPVQFIEITKTLDQGSWATIAMLTESDRDIFEVADNEVSAHMLPRMKWPYRTHRINLQAKDDATMPTDMFVGNLLDKSIDMVSDLKHTSQQDGLFQILLDFDSPEAFMLQNDIGAPLWYHRANNTTDQYHWNFTTNDSITFDQIITLIIAWMNQGRPTTDYPITYSYSAKAVSPYTANIFDPVATSIMNTDGDAATLTLVYGSSVVSGIKTTFTSDFFAGMKIKLDAYSTWYTIASITNDTQLILTSPATGNASGTASYNMNLQTIVNCKDVPTWEILRKILAHMGSVEGVGKKYIPSCSTTGVIDVALGGFDKIHAVDEDFRDTWGAQDNTSFTIPGGSVDKFNLIYVPFTAVNDAEYWFQLILYESDGIGGWTQIYSYPSSGYEYIPYDANNVHGGKYVAIPTQTAGTYKWDAYIATSGGFNVAGSGGLVYSPAAYNVVHDPENPTTKVSFRKLKTFVATQGKCAEVMLYTLLNKNGCYDGGEVTTSGNPKTNFCPDNIGCYPDPKLAEAVNPTYGILGLTASHSGTSSELSAETICRGRSQDIYECHQNIGSQIREPLDVNLVFNNGWTANLIGKYLHVFSPELDDMVIVRCTEQRHVLRGQAVKTFVRAFRI